MSYFFDENAAADQAAHDEVKAEVKDGSGETKIDVKAYDEKVRKLYEEHKKEIFDAAVAFDKGKALTYIRKAWDFLPHAVQWNIYKNPVFKYFSVIVGALPLTFGAENLVEFGFIDYKGHANEQEYADDVASSGKAQEFMMKVAEWVLEDPESQAFLKLVNPIMKASNEFRREVCIEIHTHLQEERVMRDQKEASSN